MEKVRDNAKQEFFKRKIRIALLGETSFMSQNQVTELCKKFFDYGIEYEKSLKESNTPLA